MRREFIHHIQNTESTTFAQAADSNQSCARLSGSIARGVRRARPLPSAMAARRLKRDFKSTDNQFKTIVHHK